MLPGGRCTVYYTNYPNIKGRLSGMSAVALFIASFCCLVAAAWYSKNVETNPKFLECHKPRGILFNVLRPTPPKW